MHMFNYLYMGSLKFHPGRSVLKDGTYDFPNARAVSPPPPSPVSPISPLDALFGRTF